MSATYLQHLFADARAVELRIQQADRWRSGVFDSLAALRTVIEAHAGANLYTTLNRLHGVPVSNAMGGRASRDDDVALIVRLPIDFDPVRPIGESSTDAELTAAVRKRNALVAMLSALGWPMPAIALSGNGAHALYRCVVKRNDETRDMLREVYQGLREDFSDAAVTFDASVRNPSRIWRLYGSVNRKGTPTPERPHRLAVVRIPERWDGVAPKQIEALAGHYARRLRPQRERAHVQARAVVGAGDFTTLDIVAWFAAHGALKRALGRGRHAVTCPWLDEHQTPDAPHKSDSVIWEAEAGRWPTFFCSHAHCEGRSLADVLRLWGDADAFCTREWRRATA